LQPWPKTLCDLTERQIATLDGPEATAAPAERLVVFLERALDAGFAANLSAIDDALRRLIKGPRELHALAARLLVEMPPTTQLVDATVVADENYATASPYAAVRLNQARALGDIALDNTLPTNERVDALSLARKADGPTARGAAFRVGSSAPVELRHAVAEVLASTDGALAETDAIQRLLDQEPDLSTKELLEQALRHITSGSVGEALRNLLKVLDIVDEAGEPDVAVVLPHPSRHEAFVHCVDEARTAIGGPPTGAVQALLRLGENLVEQAIGTVWLADPRRKSDGEKLLNNLPGKTTIGALVQRQELLQSYEWLSSYAALRNVRGVHPAPTGSTEPVKVGPEDVIVAKKLIADVVLGWLKTMYGTASR
jgi:hypothetical protein